MNSNKQQDRPATNDLARIIEPLANYICAARHPRQALVSALAALRREVEQTNRVAVAHCRTTARCS